MTDRRWRITKFLELIAVRLLRLMGDEWHAGRLAPAPEHLATSVLHDIVAEIMRGFARIVGATAAADGWNILYFGADLPDNDIARRRVCRGRWWWR